MVRNGAASQIVGIQKDIVGIQKDIQYLTEGQDRLEKSMGNIEEHYLTKEDFVAQMTPIQRFVYGLIALVLTAVFGAGITLILKK